MFNNNKDKQKDSKVKIKVSPLFSKADTVRDTVTGMTFTSKEWVEVEAKDAERLLNNNMDIFIVDIEEDEAVLDEADSTVEDDEAVEDNEDTIEESHEDEAIFEDSIGLDEQE